MYRYFDAIFSHKLLILLPLIVVTSLSVAGSLFLSRSYNVSATIWIDSAPLLSISDTTKGYQQPNQIEADALGEWLGTKSFIREIIERTGLQEEIEQGKWPKPSTLETDLANLPVIGSTIRNIAPQRSNNRQVLLDRAVEQVRKSLNTGAVGTHFVKISYRGGDAQLGMKLVNEVIKIYSERSTGRKAENAKAAIDFFQTQLQERAARLEASSQALLKFKEAHPVAPNTNRPPAEEQELAELERQYSQDLSLYNAVLNRLEQARLSGAADLEKTQISFQIADPPEVPLAGGFDMKKVITFSVVGLIVGLCLGLGTVLVMAWLDKTVKSSEDLLNTMDIPVLATISHLTVPKKRAFSRTKEHAVRQFMGDLIAEDSLGA